MGMTNETLINVTNRSDFTVGYPIPEGMPGQERTFAPGETKKLPFVELQKLSWLDGGFDILKNYLVIENPEALDLILGSVEPEYYYTEEKIKALLLEGTIDQLLDTFDFGTAGVIELIKKYAVELEIPDIRKRQIIQEKTGLDIDKAILIENEYKEDVNEEVKTRRAAPVESSEPATNSRRVPTDVTPSSKYKKVVIK